MKCEKFVEEVKVIFGYLFDIHSFSVVYTREELNRTDYCLLGLENPACRIIIYKTRSEGNVWIGPLDAPFGWELKGYNSARSLLMFILKQPFSFPDYETFPSVEDQLNDLSGQLQPHLQELLSLFLEDELENWQDDYNEFRYQQEKIILRHLESKR